MINLAIFASGSGSNAEAILNYFKDHNTIRVATVLSNNSDAYVLERAKNHGVCSKVFNRESFESHDEIIRYLEEKEIDLIILAGFLWLIPQPYLERFHILNIHPALLPKYGGKGFHGIHVHRAVKEAGDTQSGITIHEVNEKYDEGNILYQENCDLDPKDMPEDIAAKVLKLEHKNYPRVIEEFATNTIKK